MGYTTYKNTTIASGSSLTSAVRIGGGVDQAGNTTPDSFHLFAIIFPSAWTAANATFQISADGTTFVDLYDADGTETIAQADASRAVHLDPAIFSAVPYLKIRSGTSGTPVNQAADRVLTLVLRDV